MVAEQLLITQKVLPRTNFFLKKKNKTTLGLGGARQSKFNHVLGFIKQQWSY